jgi:DNA polymerase
VKIDINFKKSQLKRLNQEINNCKKCDLCKTRKRAVPGEGPLNAKIMILGQAPGSEEDKTGRPFVGRAGRFLDRLLEIAGIKREEAFITSPIKCFPPKNRRPKREEIKACLPYLKKQIEIINPQKLILLGQVAFCLFFPKERLSDLRGRWLKREDREFFVTFHPAAGLRFPKMRDTLEKDFKHLLSD